MNFMPGRRKSGGILSFFEQFASGTISFSSRNCAKSNSFPAGLFPLLSARSFYLRIKNSSFARLFVLAFFDESVCLCRSSTTFGLWLSLVERLVRDEEVEGSNPSSPIEIRAGIFSIAGGANQDGGWGRGRNPSSPIEMRAGAFLFIGSGLS